MAQMIEPGIGVVASLMEASEIVSSRIAAGARAAYRVQGPSLQWAGLI